MAPVAVVVVSVPALWMSPDTVNCPELTFNADPAGMMMPCAQAWEGIKQVFEDNLTAIEAEYTGYQIMTDGHSLGGGMAQTAALENGLSGYGQNSLPISQTAIDKDMDGDLSGSLAAWTSASNTFNEVNVSGDPATLYYSSLQGQTYQKG